MSAARIRQQPRLLLRLAALLLIALAVVLTVRGERAAATSGASPYDVPVVTDTNPDPNIVETTIVADEATVDIGNGVMANALTFNGTIPGPEFRLEVGQTAIVHFENQAAHATGIHWHGIELANASDGTPLTQNMVPPGGTFLYTFTVTRPGTFWYHPHHHSSTNQVFKGLYGSIVVTDPDEAALQASGVLPPAAQTRTLVLSDVTVCKAVGSNDTTTYDTSQPWLDGTAGPFPGQGGPSPEDLCEGAPIDEDGNPRGPFAAGDVPNNQRSGGSGQVNEGQTVLTNGKNVGGRAGSPTAPGALAGGAAALDVQPGQGLRLRLVSTTTTRFFRLRLTDGSGALIPLVKVGGQGGLLDEAVVMGGVSGGFDFKYTAGEILLDPGEREDVVIAVPASATGALTLWTLDFERTGTGFAKLPTVPVAHLNVTGPAASPAYSIAAGTPLLASIASGVEVIGPATGALVDPATLSPAELGTPNPDIQLTNIESGAPGLGINGVEGVHDFAGDYTAFPHTDSSRWANIGDTLELTVTNRTGAHHPFHLHGFSIQPISFTDLIPGDADGTKPPYVFPYHEFRDTIDIPARYTLTFRIRLDDRPMMDGTTPGGGLGRWVFHCHIFFHAVFGMISELVVIGTPSTNAPPTIAADAPAVTVPEGTTATMTGTYSDPDGDALAFVASAGAVVDDGSGGWSWSLPTTDGPPDSQTVTITATDPDGESASVDFDLTVENVAPATTIASPADGALFQLADSIPVSAPFTDPGTGDTHTCAIAWGDATSSAGTVAEASGSGTCAGSHTYSTGGLKTITVTVTDDDGDSSSASVTIDVNTPPDCTPVKPSPASLWPANGKLVAVTLSGATDADGDVVTLTVTGVTQDEPVNGKGDGNTAPDAALVPAHSERVQLRAERSGTGNGRVYRIAFGGDDGRGGTCTATKKAIVVHDQHDTTAVDSLLVFNSL